MSLRSEYRELGIKRNRGHSSLNKQHGDGDEDDTTSRETPEKESREDRRPWAAYLMVSGEGVIEPLIGRLKAHPTIKRASVCRSEKSAQRLVQEWQETYAPPVS